MRCLVICSVQVIIIIIILRAIKLRRMRVTVHVARVGEMTNSYTAFVEKPEGMIPLE
jgi:hypothetical protein